MGYTKLFSEILDSSIWSEPHATRLVWITMLAMSDREGIVQAALPGLARRACVSLEECETAITTLLAPDPYSRSKIDDGRRIKEVDGGWFLLNHGAYRAKLSAEERREYNRRKQQEYRERKKSALPDVNDTSITVNHNVENAHITDADTDTDTDTEEKEVKEKEASASPPPSPPAPPTHSDSKSKGTKSRPTRQECIDYAVERGELDIAGEDFFDTYESKGWKRGKTPVKDWKATMRNAIRGGWGLFPGLDESTGKKNDPAPRSPQGKPKQGAGNYMDRTTDYYEKVANKREQYDARSREIARKKEEEVESETPEQRAAALAEFQKMKRSLVNNIGNV